MPISEHVGVLALVALLAACSEERAAERRAEAQVERPVMSARAERTPCAHDGQALAPDCTIDRDQTDQGLTLTVRHPDGAFRRLTVATDGRGVVAADGAEPARVSVLDAGRIGVAIGTDRYELPATVQERAARP